MKLKKITLISFLLLAIMMIGAVSAEDVTSDALNAADDEGFDDVIGDGDDDDLEPDDDEGDEPFDEDFNETDPDDDEEEKVTEITVNTTGSGIINEENTVYVYLPEGVGGTLTIYTDEDDLENDEGFEDYVSSEDYYPFVYNFIFQTPGIKHTLFVNFESDDVEAGPNYSNEFYFQPTNDYDILISADDEGSDLVYGGNANVDVSFPSQITSGTGEVYVNGVKYMSIDFSDFEGCEFKLDNLNTSELVIKAVYNGNSIFAKKTVTRTFKVNPTVSVPVFTYEQNPTIIVNYTKCGDTFVIMDYEGNVYYEGDFRNGAIAFTLNHTIPFGDELNLKFMLNGENYGYAELRPAPKISLPQKMWVQDSHYFTAEFPEEYIGWNLTVSVGEDLMMFEGNYTGGELTLLLPDLEAGDYTIKFEFYKAGYEFYNEEYGGMDYMDEVYVTSSWDITLMNDNPNFELESTFPESIAKGSPITFTVYLPEGAEGTLTVTVNGVKKEVRTIASTEEEFELSSTGLVEGKSYAYSIQYSGDGYFSPKTLSGTLKILQYVIYVPQTVVINDEPESGRVDFKEGLKGTLYLLVDGKSTDEFDLESNDYSIEFGLDELSVGNHTIGLIYKDTKNQQVFKEYRKVFVTYTILFDDEEGYDFIFGGENTITASLPSNALKKSISVYINNEKYTNWKYSAGQISVDVSPFLGNNTITVKYAADTVYPFPCEANTTFMARTAISYRESLSYNDTEEAISLKLPGSAGGVLQVIIYNYDDELVLSRNLTFTDGHAGLVLNTLDLGDYRVSAKYVGDDYVVDDVDFDLYVSGAILVEGIPSNSTLGYGSSIKAYLYLPKDANGELVAEYDGGYQEIPVNNGYAEIILKASSIGVGEKEIRIYYSGIDYSVDEIWPIVYVAPQITVSNMVVFSTNNKITVNAHDDCIYGYVEVLVDDNGETFTASFEKELVDGKATILLSGLTAGKHQFTITLYADDGFEVSEVRTVTVKEASAPQITAYAIKSMFYQDGTLFKAKVIGKDGKPLKDTFVTIYINNKKVKSIKTDSKGYISYNVPNLPGNYKAYVKYGNAKSKTVAINVKQPLLLKLAYVKQSAKKLVLTATLKSKNKAGKWITFRFNGVTLKGKTNSKGVASVTVKQTVLKKLKVGSKVTYTATYVKTTVKKTVLVRK